jgi:hypothetical protein
LQRLSGLKPERDELILPAEGASVQAIQNFWCALQARHCNSSARRGTDLSRLQLFASFFDALKNQIPAMAVVRHDIGKLNDGSRSAANMSGLK